MAIFARGETAIAVNSPINAARSKTQASCAAFSPLPILAMQGPMSSMPESMRQSLGLRDGEVAIVKDTSRPINLPTFARAIAKIGYCHAVAHYGMRGLRSLVLPDLILGKYPHIPYFVGGDMSLRHRQLGRSG